MATAAFYTAEMVRALPEDGKRYETVYGELLVTPSPRAWHQIVLQRLNHALHEYVEANGLGVLLASPADISWGEDILVQPDLFVVDPDEARTLDWSQMKTLELVVEVLSPRTEKRDRFTKRKLYQTVGVSNYWIVDADEKFVEVWTPGATFPIVEHEQLVWHPADAPSPLILELGEVFRPL